MTRTELVLPIILAHRALERPGGRGIKRVQMRRPKRISRSTGLRCCCITDQIRGHLRDIHPRFCSIPTRGRRGDRLLGRFQRQCGLRQITAKGLRLVRCQRQIWYGIKNHILTGQFLQRCGAPLTGCGPFMFSRTISIQNIISLGLKDQPFQIGVACHIASSLVDQPRGFALVVLGSAGFGSGGCQSLVRIVQTIAGLLQCGQFRIGQHKTAKVTRHVQPDHGQARPQISDFLRQFSFAFGQIQLPRLDLTFQRTKRVKPPRDSQTLRISVQTVALRRQPGNALHRLIMLSDQFDPARDQRDQLVIFDIERPRIMRNRFKLRFNSLQFSRQGIGLYYNLKPQFAQR